MGTCGQIYCQYLHTFVYMGGNKTKQKKKKKENYSATSPIATYIGCTC